MAGGHGGIDPGRLRLAGRPLKLTLVRLLRKRCSALTFQIVP